MVDRIKLHSYFNDLDNYSGNIKSNIQTTGTSNILLDKNNYFHSIGNDLTNLESILTNGILSKNMALQLGVDMTRNYKYGFNGNDYISVADSPVTNKKSDDLTAFEKHIKTGISFIISNSNAVKDIPCKYGSSSYTDESFIKDCVPVKNIEGIMIPHESINTNIKDVKMGYKHIIDNSLIEVVTGTKQRLDNISGIEIMDTKFDELIKAFDNTKNNSTIGRRMKYDMLRPVAEEIDMKMTNHMAKVFKQKLKKETDICIIDVVKHYINELDLKIPIYDTTGKIIYSPQVEKILEDCEMSI